MGLVTKLAENLFKVRIIPANSAENSTSFSSTEKSAADVVNEAIDAGKKIDLSELLKITTLRGDRNTKYAIYEEMVADGRIGAAVEMYSNDTVQYNAEGKVIWVESEDTDVAKYCNKLLDDLNIAENIWSYAYGLWLYGDVYLETFQNTSNDNSKPTLLLEPLKSNPNVRTQREIKGAKLERYVEKVPNPADVYDLQYKGKTVGFVKNNSDINNTLQNNIYLYSGSITDINILHPTKYVHMCLSPNITRFPEQFNLLVEDPNKLNQNGEIDGSSLESSGGSLSFKVKSGQSILENVYGPYQTLKLKEESVLLERITKSSITRVIQVELGDMPESQKKRKLQEIKNQIEQQLIMNKETGTLQSRAGAQPIENIIYTTTKNGKGAISTVNIGGDVEIGNTDDITQSENKVFGSLLTPKAALGADMEGTGLSNGGSLTELNTTYARRIKRGQIAIIAGIKTLINIFALSEGVTNVVNNFEVKLTPIITVEDNRRDELMQTKIRNINDILSLMDNIETIDETTKLNMIIDWLSKYLNQQDIVNIINEKLQEIEDEEKSNPEVEPVDNNDFEISPRDENELSAFNEPDTEVPSMPEIADNTGSEETKETTPETAPQVNLADIEGEDLV